MSLVHDLIVGTLDASQYEDACRTLLGALQPGFVLELNVLCRLLLSPLLALSVPKYFLAAPAGRCCFRAVYQWVLQNIHIINSFGHLCSPILQARARTCYSRWRS